MIGSTKELDVHDPDCTETQSDIYRTLAASLRWRVSLHGLSTFRMYFQATKSEHLP